MGITVIGSSMFDVQRSMFGHLQFCIVSPAGVR
jgi:hypothetical protein